MKLAMNEFTQQHDHACVSNSRTSTLSAMALEHPFLQLLELPTSPAASSVFLSPTLKQTLFGKRQIHGVVYPDLPSRSLLSALFSTGAKAGKKSSNIKKQISPSLALSASKTAPEGAVETIVQQAGLWQVRTVAAQLRSMRDIRSRLVITAQALDGTGCGGSLLLVSGGHPLRRFPLVERLLPCDSLDMLGMASRLRQSGEIPPGIQLWAVENPLANTVDRLEQKILAGAETVIVQPPLLQDVFEDWWNVAYGRGLMKHIHVVVGLPFITSANNLEFWFGLAQASGDGVNLRLAELRKVDATHSMDVLERSAFYKEKTKNLLKFIKNLPGVGGIHLMPVTPSGWRQFAELQD